MSKCIYLSETHENSKPRTSGEARLLIGEYVKYLREVDIDKTGRGFYFPRFGFIENVFKNNIIISGDYISINDIRELIVL